MALSPPRLASLTLFALMDVEMVVSLSGGGLSRPTQHYLHQMLSFDNVCKWPCAYSSVRLSEHFEAPMHACMH